MEADGRRKRQTDDIYYSSANEEYRYKRDVSNETQVYGWVLPSVDLSVHSSYIQWVQWPQEQNMSLVESFPLLGFLGKLDFFLFWALWLPSYQIWVKLASSCRENGENYRWRILFCGEWKQSMRPSMMAITQKLQLQTKPTSCIHPSMTVHNSCHNTYQHSVHWATIFTCIFLLKNCEV